MSYGANCAHTLSDKTEQISTEQFIAFLEPSEKPKKGAAICQSAEDWNKQKTALEEACRKLGGGCTYEMQSALAKTSGRIDALQTRALSRPKGRK